MTVKMSRQQLFALSATIIGSAIVFLDGSVVNLALPHIGQELGAGFSGLQWIMDGYLLSLSALILLGGSLGDIFGLRRIYMLGLVGFGITSLLCGLAPNVETLILLRLAQGAFGAMLVPSALAVINTSFEPAMRSVAFGHWTALSAMVTALGPLLGGYLVDVASWRWIFFINVPLVIATVVLARLGVAETKGTPGRRVDVVGAALAMLGLGSLTYGLIEGPVSRWQPMQLAAVIMGFVLLAVFLLYERRRPDPMLKLALFKSRNFIAANSTTFALYGALGGFMFALAIFLQEQAGYTALMAGASTVPVAVVLFLVSPRAGKWSGEHGSRLPMTFGPLVAAAGMGWLAFIGADAGFWTEVIPGVTVFALGLAMTVAPLTTTVMSAVPAADSGIASGVNNAVSRVAGLVVIALLGLLGSYEAAALFCALLAAVAGGLSFWLVENRVPAA